MTTETETKTTKAKQAPAYYIFENGTDGTKGGKPAGAAFVHKKGNGFTLLIGGKRYAAFPPKAKSAAEPEAQPEQPATGEGA